VPRRAHRRSASLTRTRRLRSHERDGAPSGENCSSAPRPRGDDPGIFRPCPRGSGRPAGRRRRGGISSRRGSRMRGRSRTSVVWIVDPAIPMSKSRSRTRLRQAPPVKAGVVRHRRSGPTGR
jgi:hypothetical protein